MMLFGTELMIALAAIAGIVALYVLLPRPEPIPPAYRLMAAFVALFLLAGLIVPTHLPLLERLLFRGFSGGAVIGGVLLVTLPNPARAALSFVLVILSTCGLFLLLAAPFVMAATIIVYAGAIIVTFLFVLMLAQAQGPSDADDRSREPLLSAVAGFALLAAILTVLHMTYDTRGIDEMIAATQRAATQPSVTEIEAALGGPDAFFARFNDEAKSAPGSLDQGELFTKIDNMQANWPSWKRENRASETQEELRELAAIARRVRDSFGSLPAAESAPRSPFSVRSKDSHDNVAALGRSLFTDYLLAVELGGTLLTVATIGAIVIAGRRPQKV